MTQSEHIKLIDKYNALKAELDAAREGMKAALEKLSVQMEKNSALEDEVASLKDQLYWLRKKVFGKMSEKNLPVDPRQLNLFETGPMSEDEQAELRKAVTQQEQTITRTITVSKPSRKPIDTTRLPVEEINIYPDGTTTPEGALKDGYVEIGTEETLRMETVPARVYVVRTIRHKVMLRSDAGKYPEDRMILTPSLPPAPISKCIAGASVLTDIIVGKYMYHLPFYRQIQQYREYGVSLNDSTVGGWYEAAVEKLKLLYDLLRQKILSSEYIQVDESVIPVLDDERHKARKGYEWCVRDGLTGDVMFYYDRGSRSGRVARELLGGYRGFAQTDGYEVYDQFESMEDITMCGCWAHARRKFADALKENRTLSSEALYYISRLYAVESKADDEGLKPEKRMELRREKSYPVIQAFEKWMQTRFPQVSPQSRMGKAIAYTYALLPRLSRYVNDGRINIDNNLIENAIRPLALGRKNYLFCGNDASAYRAAIVYSLIGTCKAAGVEPRLWMEDALRQIPYYERDGRDLADLLPREWAKRHK
ncbi:MAG: IS66 family transposase [Bacteroidaceae bacterium]|nr:IS66 family transposase [Bacteroidaceae bacterium]